MSETDEDRADAWFHALADRTRRDILRRVLAGEHSVSTLARGYDMSFAAVQKHVAVLERAGLITLKDGVDVGHATQDDIASNPKGLRFTLLDFAAQSRALPPPSRCSSSESAARKSASARASRSLPASRLRVTVSAAAGAWDGSASNMVKSSCTRGVAAS